MLCPHCGQETGFSSAITWNAPINSTLSWNPALAATNTVTWPYWNTNASANTTTFIYNAPIGVPPYASTLHSQDSQTDTGDAQESARADPCLSGTTAEAEAQSSADSEAEASPCWCGQSHEDDRCCEYGEVTGDDQSEDE